SWIRRSPEPGPGRNRPWTWRRRPESRWSGRRSSWPGRIWTQSFWSSPRRPRRPELRRRTAGLVRSGIGGDGLAGGDEGVHHGLVPHLGAGHVVELLQGLGKYGLEARHVDLL